MIKGTKGIDNFEYGKKRVKGYIHIHTETKICSWEIKRAHSEGLIFSAEYYIRSSTGKGF